MARISTYPIDGVVTSADKLIGTDGDNLNATVNFNIDDIKTYINSGGGLVSSLTTTGTSGVSTLSGGVLNIPNYANTQNTLTTTGTGAATLVGTVLNIPTPVIPSVPFTSLTTTGSSGAATLTGGVLNIPTYTGGGGGSGVTSFTNANGTFISAATVNTAATGSVTTGVIDLSAAGTPSASTFLRGDNTWATIPGGYTNWLLDANTSGSAAVIFDGLTVDFLNGTGISVTKLNKTITHALTNTGVTAGPYTNADITVDAQGRITAAANGSGGGGGGVTSVTGTLPIVSSGGTTPTVSVNTMTAASAGAAGLKGAVPASLAGDQGKFLRADATWQVVSGSGTVTEVTGATSADGFIRTTTTSPNTTPVVTAALQYTGTPTNETFLAGDMVWRSEMSSSIFGLGKLQDSTIQSVAANPVTAQATRTYGIQENSSNQLVVNVPWTDTGGGSVTSVGLAAPSAFTVSNTPVTTTGILTLAGAGATTEYIDGTGALQTFPNIPQGIVTALSTNLTSGAATLSGGTLNIPVYSTSAAGASGDVQFNNGSNGFAAESEFNYDTSNNTLTVTGVINQPSLKLASAQPTTPSAGSLLSEIESYYSASEVGKIRFVGDGAFNASSAPSRLELQTASSGSIVATTKATIKSDGKLILEEYGAGTFTGTLTKQLGVTSTGEVIEQTPNTILQNTSQSLDLNSASFIAMESSNVDLTLTNTSNLAKICEIRALTSALGTSHSGILTVKVNTSNSGGGAATTQLKYLNSAGVAVNINVASANTRNFVLTFTYYGSDRLILLNATEV